MQPENSNAAKALETTPSTAVNLIEELDIAEYLVLKKPDEDGPEVMGGYLDALIVHASQRQKHTENSKFSHLYTYFALYISLIAFRFVLGNTIPPNALLRNQFSPLKMRLQLSRKITARTVIVVLAGQSVYLHVSFENNHLLFIMKSLSKFYCSSVRH